jgi:putative ABC transport system permease protein
VLACANVSNLLLARAAARRSEIAVRLAIGARRGRVIRQMLTESAVLSLCAAALTLPLAYLLPELVLRFVDRAPPTNLDLTPNGTVLLYSIAIAALSAAFFGLAPAFRSTRMSLMEAIKRQDVQASPRFPLRSVLLGVQIAISIALLTAAALLVRGLDRARSLDLGFSTDGISAIEIVLPPNLYDAARERQLFDDLAERLEGTGEPFAISQHTPLSFGGYMPAACFGGTTFEHPVYFQAVTSRYFELMQIPLAAGRNLLPEDRQRGGILVNETFARLCWPDRNPVGLVEKLGGVEREIVGVVRDAQLNFVGSVVPTFFESFGRGDGAARRSATVVLPSSMTPAGIAAIRALEPRAAAPVVTLDEQVRRSLGETVGVARIAGALGLLALLLATLGVYGVVSYTVEQRRREIGVRMALGARPDQVMKLVLHRNAAAIGAGAVVGLVIAAGESVYLRSQLYGLSPADPLAYGGALLVLLLAGVAASVVPARRAARTDPNTVLHYD